MKTSFLRYGKGHFLLSKSSSFVLRLNLKKYHGATNEHTEFSEG